VETVKGYASHERQVFENVTAARASAMNATRRGAKSGSGKCFNKYLKVAVCGRGKLSAAARF